MKGWIREGLHPFSDDGNPPLCKSKLGGVSRELSAYHAKVYGSGEMYCSISLIREERASGELI